MAFGDFARGSHLETMPRRWGGQCCTAVWPAVTIVATTVDRGGSAAIGMRQTEALAACAVRPPREPRRLASACAGRAIATIWRNIPISLAGRCPLGGYGVCRAMAPISRTLNRSFCPNRRSELKQ